MAWIKQSFIWITLIFMSVTGYRYHDYGYPPYYDYHFDEPYQITPRPHVYKPETSHINYRGNQRSIDRVDGQWRPSTKVNERSIPPSSGVQRVQEQEGRRIQSRVDDSVSRIENGASKIINNRSKGWPAVANRRGVTVSQPAVRDSVIFPGPTSKRSNDFNPEIPEECIKTGYCENVPNYPEDRVQSVLQELGNLTDLFKVDEMEYPEIAQRIGPPEESELCEFARKVIIPRAAQDRDGKWSFIINPNDKPLQGFHVETCNAGDAPCSKLVRFYAGYEATCKQKYILRYMLGLDEKGEKIEKTFRVPSCCTCVVRQVD